MCFPQGPLGCITASRRGSLHRLSDKGKSTRWRQVSAWAERTAGGRTRSREEEAARRWPCWAPAPPQGGRTPSLGNRRVSSPGDRAASLSDCVVRFASGPTQWGFVGAIQPGALLRQRQENNPVSNFRKCK